MTLDPAFEKARQLAVAYIGIDRFKSSGRVRNKLLQKGVEPDLADRVVNYYIDLDYINDLRAAQGIARRYQDRHLRSRRAMVAVFIRNGLDPSVAQKAALDLEEDAITALRLCRLSFDHPGPEDEEAMMKLMIRRGYPASLARRITRACLKGEKGDSTFEFYD